MQKKIGKRIHDARVQAGMTQEVLAEKANMSVSLISRLETGRNMVSIEKLYNLSLVLGVGLQDLLCDLFTYEDKDSPVLEELNHYISSMTQSEMHHLLEYVKLFKRFIDKS